MPIITGLRSGGSHTTTLIPRNSPVQPRSLLFLARFISVSSALESVQSSSFTPRSRQELNSSSRHYFSSEFSMIPKMNPIPTQRIHSRCGSRYFTLMFDTALLRSPVSLPTVHLPAYSLPLGFQDTTTRVAHPDSAKTNIPSSTGTDESYSTVFRDDKDCSE